MTEEAVLGALRTYGGEVHLRTTARDPDLRAGHIRVFHVRALDLADLLADRNSGWRTLQRLRADDRLFDLIKQSLDGHLDGCKQSRSDIENRMENAVQLEGKSVWTEQFLERFAPLELPTSHSVPFDGGSVDVRNRLAPDPGSELHFVRLDETKLQIFRDGTFVFTLKTSFQEQAVGSQASEQPASVQSIIERLAKLDRLATEAFHGALCDFLRPQKTRERLAETLTATDCEPVTLIQPEQLDRGVLRRRAEKHAVIVIERFFNKDVTDLKALDPANSDEQNGIVPLHTVLASSSLAGILNTAGWFHSYNTRYVSRLTDKEIGYRDDEIYITDRKATVVSAAGIWSDNDPLRYYIQDVVLAVEYNLALLAYFASTLSYYQEHQDVRSLEQADPLAALRQVNDGRAILSQMVESLDLTILVDHGFTRLFVDRLRSELGFKKAIEFIRQRVEDASTGVGLRSSVDAAENTSKKSLKAAHQTRRLTAVGVAVALGLGIFGFYIGRQDDITVNVTRDVCLKNDSSARVLAYVCGTTGTPAPYRHGAHSPNPP